MNRPKLAAVVGVVAAIAMLAAAAASSNASDPRVIAAKKEVAALTKQPTKLVVPALPAKPETGKTLEFVVCPTATCLGFAEYLKEATAAVGWKLKTVPINYTPTAIANAWNKVIRDNPDGVVVSGGIPASLFAKQLETLHKKGIPVVLHDQTPEPQHPGVTAVVLSNKENFQFGKELGQLILADSNGENAHVAMFVTPEVPVFANESRGMKSVIQSGACKGCSLEFSKFSVADVPTKLPNQVVSFLRAHPEIQYAYFDFNDAVNGVPAALKRAGLDKKVKIVANNLASPQAAYIKAGTMWGAAANPWPEVLWKDFHIILAKLQNAPLARHVGIVLPNQIIIKKNVPSKIDQGGFPLVLNYRDVFKKAWHVQ